MSPHTPARAVLCAACALVLASHGAAAAPSADSLFLDQYAATYRFRLGFPGNVSVTPDGDAVLFLRSGARSFVQDLVSFDVATGRERVLCGAEGLLRGAQESLTAAERARRERLRVAARGITSYQLSEDGRLLLVPLSGRLFVVERRTGSATELVTGGPAEDPQLSPDGAQVAWARDGDLFAADVATGKVRQLTRHEGGEVSWGTAEFVAQEEMDREHGFWWSPDSKRLLVQRTDTREVERMHISDPAHPERPPQSWPYPRPGRPNAEVTLHVLPAGGGGSVAVAWDRERYPYLAAVAWSDSAPPTLVVQNRRQREEVVLAADPATGATRTLLVEADSAWLNLFPGAPRWLPDGGAFLWITERHGNRELELRGRDGGLLASLTSPALNLRQLLHVDRSRGVAWVVAGEEPGEAHLFLVPLDPRRGAPERMTLAAGLYTASFARRSQARAVLQDPLAGERRWVVCRADGDTAGELASVGEAPPFVPQVELAAVGARGFRAAVVRPRDFDPARRYPVIVTVYGGPHTQMAVASRRSYVLAQWIADHGFVVVSADGRGTPARGRDWERAIRGDLISVPLADQVEALQGLGARFPEMDLARVGVWGWSFGGYFTAMAVMQRPDVFRAGLAGAPVTDWRDYDTHYTERYLGLPGPDSTAYRTSSVLTYAGRLSRPLLVVHGTADDNVYFVHSLKLMDAITRAGRRAEFLPLVGHTHMVTEPLATLRLYSRLIAFFEEHLRGL